MTRPTTPMDLGRLRRVQAGARAILALGIGASLAANVLAADASLIGRVIAAWSPLALLLTVELLSRVPVAGGWLSRLRVVAAATIAGIAAWVSYWHMAEVALAYGEASVAAHLLPFSVDGLVVVASVCLVELANRVSDAEAQSPRGRQANPQATRVRRRAGEHTTSNGSAPSTGRPSGRANGSPVSIAGRLSDGSRSVLGDEVRRLAAEHPAWTQAELAERAGCSVRTVRRHLSADASDRNTEGVSAPDAGAERGPIEEPNATEVAVG